MGNEPSEQLRREAGVAGAVLLGLGSILGTGVFVIVGLEAAQTGPWILLAIAAGAVVAAFNGLNSAQLAAAYPVSGGAYEYGYRLLGPSFGYAAGWLFLLAKSASAATAALAIGSSLHAGNAVWLALAVTLAVLALTLSGLRRSNQANAAILTITLAGLFSLVFGPAGEAPRVSAEPGARAVLEACALIFVAYTGYGRIATMGEEIREPRRNIPRAMILTLVVSALLYAGVGWAWLRGAVAGQLFVVAGYVALLGVLLNLVLGLSRVALAMGRRADLPSGIARLDARQQPRNAILLVGGLILLLCLWGDIKLAWSFSAGTVLVYYATLNAAAWRLPPELRLYPRWLAGAGLAGCLFLAFWVDWRAWAAAIACLAVGFLWRGLRKRMGQGH